MTRSRHPGRGRLARFATVALVVALILASASAPALGQTSDGVASIEDVTYTGDGNVSSVSGDRLYLWQAADHRSSVTIGASSAVDGEVCVVANETGRDLGCAPATLAANTTESVSVALDPWPANLTGEQDLHVVVRGANASAPLDRHSLAVAVLQIDGDLDGDGLTNRREVSLGTHPGKEDTDGDGLADRAEVLTYESSPIYADTDGDGLTDWAEIEMHLTNPTEADSEGDGLPDGRELALGTSPFNRDSDGDGLTDAVEVYTYDTNATRADTDGDGLDDGAELTTYRTNPQDRDTDGDGLSDALEVNTYDVDPGDPDTDGDGLTDGAEVNDYRTAPAIADTDHDGLADGEEVNRYRTNPLNADTDGDGLPDGAEVDRYGTSPVAIDSDGDGTSDELEVQTGLFPEIPGPGSGPGVVAALALLALLVVTGGFYGVVGRVPGRRAVASLAARLRGVVHASTSRGGDADGADPSGNGHSGQAAVETNDTVPPEFLSSEERVLRALAAHDGTMRQSDLVEETGWSKAKVSRVLSKMEEDDQITKINTGRENLVTHPDDVPPGANTSVHS